MTGNTWRLTTSIFEVRSGEILGIAGVQGNGQTELAEAITGLRHVQLGKISILDHDTTHATPRQIVEVGTRTFPEEPTETWAGALVSCT